MKKILALLFVLLLISFVSGDVRKDARDEAETTTVNVLNEIFCKLIFILFVIASGVGSIIITIEGIRWAASSDDAGARKKAKEGLIHVFVGLIIVLIAIPLVSIVMVGTDRFYACIVSAESVSSNPEILFGEGGAKFTTTLKLYEGWNLVSVPFILNDSNVTRVFSKVDYDLIYSWNATSGNWDYYLRDYGGNLSDIEIDRGYWIHVNKNTTILLLGRVPNPDRNVSLVSGWNLVGYSGYDIRPLGAALSDVNYFFAFGWNTTQALSHKYGVGWQFNSPSKAYGLRAPPKPPLLRDPGFTDMANLTHMEPGHGYWIYIGKNSSWVYPTNYPF